jgi:ATP-dependent Clp protease ATP-binding subunit ClpC
MHASFSDKVKEIIRFSREEAIRLNHDSIGAEHLILSLLRQQEDHVLILLTELNVDIEKFKKQLEINHTLAMENARLKALVKILSRKKR